MEMAVAEGFNPPHNRGQGAETPFTCEISANVILWDSPDLCSSVPIWCPRHPAGDSVGRRTTCCLSAAYPNPNARDHVSRLRVQTPRVPAIPRVGPDDGRHAVTGYLPN